MRLSIRTRLTLLISLTFLFIVVFLIVAGALALYNGLQEEMDRALSEDQLRMTELFKNEFKDLPQATGENKKLLSKELTEELDETYRYTRQFCIFSLNTADLGLYVGGLWGEQLAMPAEWLETSDGFFKGELNDIHYRMLARSYDWGRLIVGIENQTFWEVADEFKEIVFIGIPLMLVIIFMSGRFLAGLVMRPVVNVAQAAQELTLTSLEKRLPHYDGTDEFRVLTDALNAMIERIERGVDAMRQFTQDAAHELRTPLTLLRGELELLYQEEKLASPSRQVVEKMLSRAISLSKIVDDLLLLARSDSRELLISRKEFRLDQVFNDTIEDARTLVQDRPIEIKCEPLTPLTFSGDEQLIRRLLLNLADNAAKFTRAGFIEFVLREHEKTVEIIIRDTGVGIPEEEAPYIFDRFYRVEKSRSSAGSGLGLSICRWIVKAHGGRIALSSLPGRGATVTVILPKNNNS